VRLLATVVIGGLVTSTLLTLLLLSVLYEWVFEEETLTVTHQSGEGGVRERMEI
jgi:cobalt-zinc-cadmium resistance protein CzcA